MTSRRAGPDVESAAPLGARVAGWSVWGSLVTGVVSFVAGVAGILSSRFEGAGLCFLASAVAFGLLLQASFRQ